VRALRDSWFHWEQLQHAMNQLQDKGIDENTARDGLLGRDSAAVERLTFAWLDVVLRELGRRHKPTTRKGAALNGFVLYQLLRNAWELGLLPMWMGALVYMAGRLVAVESFAKREIGLGARALCVASYYYHALPGASDRELADWTGESRRQIARWRRAGKLQTGPILSVLEERQTTRS
jgi:hypothetical protein